MDDPTRPDRRAQTAEPLAGLLAQRWSPRSYREDHELSDAEVTALLEAARWAPSAANRQPRRFIVGRRGTATHELIAGTLAEGNRPWAAKASLLGLGIAERAAADGRPHRYADYDMGQALAHLSIQAEHLGLRVRQMGGFDRIAAAAAFGIAEPLEPLISFVVGVPTHVDDTDDEFAPTDIDPRHRLSLDDLVLIRE